ncbi:MAG: hypothetical protein U1E49_08085 [Hyphomicrobiaceae bacterium]
MLTTRSCPYTGIVNYYSTREPYLSVGSVQRKAADAVAWRCYIADHPASGAAHDLKAAESQLKAHLRSAERVVAEKHVAAAA